MSGAGISTHVLDTGAGRPAAGVPVTLYRRVGGDLVEAGTGTTGDDGRIATLNSGELIPGTYQLVFEVAAYFGPRPHFFSRVALDVAVTEAAHHHVPLLLSAFGCTSYRGS